MMWIYWLIAWLAGLAGVLQQGISRKLAVKAGLASALHISNLIVLVGGVVILTAIAATQHGEFAQLLKIRLNTRTWSWWFLVPGLMGLFFITVAPFLVLKIGALNLFVAVIFGQVLGSAIWDYFMEGIPLDVWRVTGAALTLLGACAMSLSKAGP